MRWQEEQSEYELLIEFRANDSHWWVSRVRARDRDSREWTKFEGPLFRTPIGATFRGDADVKASDGQGVLKLTGIELQAFAPGSVPSAIADCRPAIDPDDADGVEPLDAGQPLAGTGIQDMTPKQARGLLLELGICHTFRYVYNYADDPMGGGYSEVWCDVPPAGELVSLAYASDGAVTLVVLDQVPQTPRPQPAAGWGC